MSFGREPKASEVRALDTYLVTVADHSLNASTFAARCVISTLTDSVSAVVAAIGSLKGPLHGGAPGAVLEMLDAIGSPDRAETWINGALDRHERIMGMGHRIYRQRDPRADVLEAAIRRLTRDRGGSPRLELARSVETTAARILDERYPGRFLRPNVEFNTAVILEAIGIDRRLFTGTFAVSRVAGWLGHIEEQRRDGRLIRPRALYTGVMPA
jgi:citrate synthase